MINGVTEIFVKESVNYKYYGIYIQTVTFILITT